MNITNQRKKNKAIASLLTGVLSLQSVLPLLFASTILTGLFFNNPKPVNAEGWNGTGVYISRASVNSSGEGTNSNIFYPTLSSDGRYVAFNSTASNLVNGDNNGVSDVFRKDLQTGEVIRVSTNAQGEEANGSSYDASVSSDGRYIAFSSLASNLVNDDSNNKSDIFRKDLQTGEIVRVSADTSGNQANNISDGPSISQDGRYVVFESTASNLVLADTNGKWDIFRKDLDTGEIIRASTDSSWNESNDGSYQLSYTSCISADGRYITFMSDATNLVSGDTRETDIFWKDMLTGEIKRVSIGALEEPNDFNENPSISSDGRYVAFSSYASNLVDNDTNSNSDIFVKDIQTNEIIRASLNSSGEQANGTSYNPAIDSGGRYVTFSSYATNLVIGKNYTGWDIFRKDMLTGEVNRVSVNSQGGEANDDSFFTDINSDGRFVAFTSDATNIVDNDVNNVQDIFVADFSLHPAPQIITPIGSLITVNFGSGTSLNFDQVTSQGSTIITETESAPSPPGGFKFLSHHYDISTSASYSGNIRVAIPYDPAEVSGSEDDLRLFHYQDGNWVDVTVLPVDTANNKITGEVTSLSPFAIGEPSDAQCPLVTISNPTNNAAVSGTINIDATVDDSTAGNSNIAEALYRIDDGVPVQMNASDDSFNSTTENVKAQLDTTTLPNGNHTISVLGKDSAGNWSSASSVNVVVKNYSLIAEITYPDPESPQTPFSGTIHVTGVAKHLDKNKFSKYVLQYQKTHALDGSVVTNPAWKLIISSTEMVDDATLGKWITTSMPGIYKLRLSVYDINGNVATDTKYMRIENPAPLSTDPDTTKPVINISNISTDDNLKGKKTIKGKVFDENLSIYALQRRIDSPTSSWVTAAYSKENVNVEGATIAKWDTTKLNGKYYLRLRATDKAANTAYYPQGSDIDYTKGIKVLIDNKAPTLGDIYPKSGIFTSSLSSIYISGAYDLNPLKTTAYTTGINGDGISMKINSDENIAAYESDNKKIMYDITESLLDGNYSVEFSVPDNVGNASTFKTNFTIDSTNPTASISLARDSIKAGNKLTISGKATDKNIKSWALYQSPPTTIAYTKLTSGLTNVGKDNLNASLLIWTTPKAIGTYELKLDVTDKAGNKSTDEKTITIDNSSLFEEKAEVTYPQDNSILKGTVPVIGSATTVPTLAYYTISRKLSTTAPTTETVMYKGLSPVEDGTLSNLNLSALNGKYGLIIKRYRVGSTLPYGESVSISNLTIDNVAPIIPSVKALSSVTGGYVKSPNPTIEIKATETNSGIDETKTSVKIDGTPVSLDFSEDGNATFDSLANKIYVTLGYLDDGKHTLSVNLSDKATNPSKTYSYTFYVDTDTLDIPIPPIAEISSPMNESGFTLGATIPIVGSAYDPNILNYTLWYKKEGTLTYTKLFSGTTNIFEATLTSFKPTSKGTYEIKIVLTDKAINTPKESSVNVTIQ